MKKIFVKRIKKYLSDNPSVIFFIDDKIVQLESKKITKRIRTEEELKFIKKIIVDNYDVLLPVIHYAIKESSSNNLPTIKY